jgi:hypothetical protein
MQIARGPRPALIRAGPPNGHRRHRIRSAVLRFTLPASLSARIRPACSRHLFIFFDEENTRSATSTGRSGKSAPAIGAEGWDRRSFRIPFFADARRCIGAAGAGFGGFGVRRTIRRPRETGDVDGKGRAASAAKVSRWAIWSSTRRLIGRRGASSGQAVRARRRVARARRARVERRRAGGPRHAGRARAVGDARGADGSTPTFRAGSNRIPTRPPIWTIFATSFRRKKRPLFPRDRRTFVPPYGNFPGVFIRAAFRGPSRPLQPRL